MPCWLLLQCVRWVINISKESNILLIHLICQKLQLLSQSRLRRIVLHWLHLYSAKPPLCLVLTQQALLRAHSAALVHTLVRTLYSTVSIAFGSMLPCMHADAFVWVSLMGLRGLIWADSLFFYFSQVFRADFFEFVFFKWVGVDTRRIVYHFNQEIRLGRSDRFMLNSSLRRYADGCFRRSTCLHMHSMSRWFLLWHRLVFRKTQSFYINNFPELYIYIYNPCVVLYIFVNIIYPCPSYVCQKINCPSWLSVFFMSIRFNLYQSASEIFNTSEVMVLF